jgi:hypothetical protein
MCKATILFCFFPVAPQPNFAPSPLHEISHSISVTRSRTVGSTPWTGDQLVARPLLTAPSDCEDGEFGGINGSGKGSRSTRKKICPDATLSTTNPTCQTRARTRAAAVGSQRLNASAMARPILYIVSVTIEE